MHKIELKGIKCFAYHGCLIEESKIGQEYIVNVEITGDFTAAMEEDALDKTIDYCQVYSIVKEHMSNRQNLIETVGNNIAMEIKKHWKNVNSCRVEVIKPRPPIGGDVEEVSISVTA